jgi:hypothetical protein
MAITGAVRGLATYYTDGVERLEIHVNKGQIQGLPAKEGQRVPITLIVGGRSYEAGLRSTAECNYIWISPDLTDETGRDTRLAYVLSEAGFVKNQQIELEVSGRVATLGAPGAAQKRPDVAQFRQVEGGFAVSAAEETIDATLDSNGQLRLSRQPQLPAGPVRVTIRAAAAPGSQRGLADVIREIAAEQRSRGFPGRSAGDLRAEDDACLNENTDRDRESDAARRPALPGGS